MKMKLISLPFHWAYPSAPEKYLGCRVAIAVYDPNASEINEKRIKAARVHIFKTAVESVGGKHYRGPKLPRSVLIPTEVLKMTWEDFGRGRDLAKLELEKLGFRRFKVKDLATKPFALCPSEAVKKRTVQKLERIYQ